MMTVWTGGCYCGALRYEITGNLALRGLCLCRTCQTVSGGGGNYFAGIEAKNFRYTKGAPHSFARPDSPMATVREFCGDCGVHIAARSPRAPDGLIVKVGTLDDPSAFEGPAMVFWTDEKQAFHTLPADAKCFPRLPGR